MAESAGVFAGAELAAAVSADGALSALSPGASTGSAFLHALNKQIRERTQLR